MSADAKAWTDERGWWHGLHDGECADPAVHEHGDYHLSEVLRAIEECMETKLRWEMRKYHDGQLGLRGFCS